MTKPVTIPNTFATATTAIPLSNLDADFSTVATAMNDANTYSNYAPDTGSANAYVVTLTGVSTTYSAGLRIQFKAGNANTTASTLNVNAQGAKNITYQDASALASGTIAANSIVDVMYDGTQFLLMNDPAGGTGGDVVGPASATDNAIVRFDGTTGKLVQNSVVTIADSTGDISGVGQLNATTVDATNIEVTNIKAKDGTAAATIADSTGVVTVTAAPVMTALTASQAVFTTAGKALTSNAITGTGNVVMSASPTLTGTISAAAATLSGNLTLSGGTANGVLYLDGSKVATSGSALTFDGSNLGLGVAPSAWNSGYKALQMANAYGSISTQTGGAATLQMTWGAYATGADTWAYSTTGDSVSQYIMNSAQHRWRIAASGTAGNTITWTQAMTLGSDGLFQVGTTTGAVNDGKLQVSATGTGAGTANTVVGLNVFEETSGNKAGLWFGAMTNSNVGVIGSRTASGSIAFQTYSGSWGERARITSGGDFVVGYTAAGAYDTTSFSYSPAIKSTDTNHATGASSGDNYARFNYAGGTIGSITQNGTTGVLYNITSDYRLKTVTGPVSNAGLRIDALEPVEYTWKSDGATARGFLAHQFQEVYPNSVTGEKDAVDADGKPVYQNMQASTSEVIADLVAEIKSLRQRVAQLEGTQP